MVILMAPEMPQEVGRGPHKHTCMHTLHPHLAPFLVTWAVYLSLSLTMYFFRSIHTETQLSGESPACLATSTSQLLPSAKTPICPFFQVPQCLCRCLLSHSPLNQGPDTEGRIGPPPVRLTGELCRSEGEPPSERMLLSCGLRASLGWCKA